METETDVCPCVCVCASEMMMMMMRGNLPNQRRFWKRISSSRSEHLISLTKLRVLFLKSNQRCVCSFDLAEYLNRRRASSSVSEERNWTLNCFRNKPATIDKSEDEEFPSRSERMLLISDLGCNTRWYSRLPVDGFGLKLNLQDLKIGLFVEFMLTTASCSCC